MTIHIDKICIYIYKTIRDQKCPQMSKITRECVYFLHSTNSSCAIIHLDPDYQLILLASSHLVEKLKTLQLPLWVEGSGFQQSRFTRLSRHRTEVHEEPSIYALRQNNLVMVADSEWAVLETLTFASAQECVIF